MKASGLDFGIVRLVAVAPCPGEAMPALEPGAELELRHLGDGEFHLISGQGENAITPVAPFDPRKTPEFEAIIASSWPRLTILRHVDRDRAVLEVREFLSQVNWIGPLQIGVTEQIVHDVARLGREWSRQDPAAVATMLEDQLVLPPFVPGRATRIVVAAGGREDGTAFRMFGPKLVADVRPDADGKLVITHVGRRGGPSDRVALVEVATKIVDATAAALLSAMGLAEIEDLAGGTARYLGLWRAYNRAEERWLQRTARSFGLFNYAAARETDEGDWRFDFEPRAGLAQVDRVSEASSKRELVLEAAATAPLFFDEKEGDATEDAEDEDAPLKRQRPSVFAGIVLGIDRYGGWLLLQPVDPDGPAPPASGVIYLGQRGSETVIRRRKAAERAIRSGLCQMPQLGLLLESQPVPIPRRRLELADTPATIRTFPHGPTPAQLDAIMVAINTPDVAIIQGPPGTGKTQVIAAIVKRLEEMADPEENPAGSLLLTSFQHVAVENVARKVKPYGLPTLTMSQKRGRDTILRDWSATTAQHIEQIRQSIPENQDAIRYETLQRILAGYATGTHHARAAAARLEEAADCAAGLVAPATCDRLRQLAASLRREQRDELDGDPLHAQALRGVWGLRITRPGHDDDGPRSASAALRWLDAAQHPLPAGDRALLDSVADGETATDALLAQIGALRERLLAELTPDRRPLSIRRAPRANVLQALTQTVTEARAALAGSRAGLALALGEYLDDLRADDSRMQNTLLRYAASLAYTCQGSARGMRPLAPGKPPSGGYDTVIVDEAARANPLDLFIPMSQGRRRIILVGDHNQLPQSLEPDVERDLEDTLEQQEVAALRMSLFQRLFDDFERRAEIDGIRRTALLNTQFRMHPVLGDFVSEMFYGGAVGSGLGPEAFAHGLPRYRKGEAECVAAWIDVQIGPLLPNGRRRDPEEGEGSRHRPAEVRRIVQEVGAIRTEAPGLTIGVMSFYRRQVDALARELKPFGDAVAIGSVDEFQGREFDVVFLSMTRSNEITVSPRAGEDENAARERFDRARRSRYGFLMLRNRMCVALSRQQRLLIVVGDGAMLRDPDAGQAVPALAEFYRRCFDPDWPHGVCL